VPYAARKPRELLTLANSILGFGQLSLAKYLLIAAREDAPGLDIRDAVGFLRHVLERADWRKDLHFQTRTTMDTLDYSGTGLNEGSKVVIAAAGPKLRELASEVSADLERSLPDGFSRARVPLPGVLAISAPPYRDTAAARADIARLIAAWEGRFPAGGTHALSGFPLAVLADDAEFLSAHPGNFLWTAFTRSDPARDLDGTGAFMEDKHWGCRGSLILDARAKPHHAPALEPDPAVVRRVEARAARGGDLHGLF
jgi:4-hydroxy-3-polyprenylbenzoate decarboxylase